MLITVLHFHLHFQQCPFTIFFHETMDNSSNIWFFILAPLFVTFCKLFLYLLGDWLEGLEWTDVIMNAKIRTSGSSGAILSAARVKKTRYFHQVNDAVLYSLLKEKFDDSAQRFWGMDWYIQKRVTTFPILLHITRTRVANADVCA